MPLTAPQRLVADSDARFRVLIAGRRFGKSYLAINEVARAARQPRRRIFLVYPTYRQAKQVIWDHLKYRLQDLRWISKTNESDLTITLRNGSTISLRGADNPDSLRGVGLDFIVMDEFAMISEKAWTEVLRPTLSDRQGRALFITTPLGSSNWAYDLYQRGLSPDEHQWESFQYTTLDGGNVSEDEIAQAQRDLDARTFRQEYLATFETYANRIAYEFDRTQHLRTPEFEIPRELHIGIDFNNTPITAAILVRHQDLLYQIDEIKMDNSNTQELADEITNRYPRTAGWRHICYPDPAGRQRKTSAGGDTDFSILENAGFRVLAPHRHNLVRDRINSLNARLCSADGTHRLFIAPKCRWTIDSLEKHTYKEGTQIPDKDSGHDHMFDALSYCVDYLYPLKRDVAPQAPQRWGHSIV